MAFQPRDHKPSTTAHRDEDPDPLTSAFAEWEHDRAAAQPEPLAREFGVEGPFSSQINRLLAAAKLMP